MFVTSFAPDLLITWFIYLLPCYNTWKSIAHRPLSEPELERWAMYWSVLGVVLTFENLAQWLISWFPFYWEVKTLFLLFLSLPQTQGSTLVYATILHPYLTEKEADIDAAIVSAKANTLLFFQNCFATVYKKMVDAATGAISRNTTSDSASAGSSLALMQGLWNAYGTSALGSVISAGAPAHQRPAPSPVPSSSSIHSATSSSSDE
ncbi:hypothetical protein WOLCODRAFT_135408 [Wolfiporia cocos MD-104 SS10]|uniref:Protein YOP1 n=1 Tax=Wolfiporia cocos (strain MD-104) TaxID=742152 RepID=A0A2H3IW30_WOLCO|nr:hypothetical protein WOLCODRAFT_135408 [Wolfiporia cocos MD-104 SS10]